MTRPSVIRCFLLSIFLFLYPCANNAASTAEEVLLMRHHPLFVRWGEVELTETTRVRVVWHGTEQEYPNAVSFALKGREREEDLQALLAGRPQVQSRVSIAGSAFLAGRMGEGRSAWDSLVKKLREKVSELSPSGYKGFLDSLQNTLASALGERGSDSLVFCISRPGADDHAGRFEVSVPGDAPGPVTGSFTSYPGGEPYCPALHEAFQNLTPWEVVTTGFTVEEALEEVLAVRVEERTQQQPVSMPEGATLARTVAPEGAAAYTSISVKDGVAHGEVLRSVGSQDTEGEVKSYVLVADVRAARLPKDLTKSRSILMRWDTRIRAMRLGATPRLLAEEDRSLFIGVFCTTAESVPALEELKSGVVRALLASDSLLSPGVIRRAVDLGTLGIEDSFVVFCLSGREREAKAEYCVSNACADVTNPHELCEEISTALDD